MGNMILSVYSFKLYSQDYYCPQTKLRERTLSVHRRDVDLWPCSYVPGPMLILGGRLCLVVSVKRHPIHLMATTAANGTPPSGMHSCLELHVDQQLSPKDLSQNSIGFVSYVS